MYAIKFYILKWCEMENIYQKINKIFYSFSVKKNVKYNIKSE